MRILFISTYFQPDIASTGVLMTQIVEELAKRGHYITVITSMPHYDRNQIWEEYRGKIIQYEEHEKYIVKRLRVYVPGEKSGFLGRLLNYLSFNTFSLVVGLFSGKFDLVFVPSPPLMNGLVGDFLSRIKQIPFVYNVQDIWPDVVIRAGVMKDERIIKFSKRMEKYVYERADAISVISNGFKENLIDKGVSGKKVYVIPNFFDTEFVHPLPKVNSFSQKYNLYDKFIVLFGGNVGHSQGLEIVLDAAETISAFDDILFLIIGNGVAKDDLISYADEKGLENVKFLPFQPHEALPEMYASSDVCLVPLRKGFTNESVPCKVFTIMASGRPIVASVDKYSDTWKLVNDAEIGLNAEVGNPESLARKIKKLYDDVSLRKKLGENSRRHILHNYTREIIGEKYHELFTSIVSK